MHPCSHPRYGLIDCSKPMSGESFVLMTPFARSGWWLVATLSGTSSGVHPSSTASIPVRSKRPAGFDSEPRPFSGVFPRIVRVTRKLYAHTVYRRQGVLREQCWIGSRKFRTAPARLPVARKLAHRAQLGEDLHVERHDHQGREASDDDRWHETERARREAGFELTELV